MPFIEKEHKTERNRFTRMCIGEAVVDLMKENDYEKIRVSDIVKKAGVSRMTYYHYYGSKDEVLEDYLMEIIKEYIQTRKEQKLGAEFHNYSRILFTLTFFEKYATFVLELSRAGFYSMMINALNKYMVEQLLEEYDGNIYELYYYAGALLNVFIKWEEEGKKISAEELARIIEKFVQKNHTEMSVHEV